MDNLLEKALRMKLRFPLLGSLTCEDLWDVGVEQLDACFQLLSPKGGAGISLLKPEGYKDEKLELQLEILRRVVEVKLAEAQAKTEAKARKAKRQKLMEVLESKKEGELLGKTTEELQKMLDDLEG